MRRALFFFSSTLAVAATVFACEDFTVASDDPPLEAGVDAGPDVSALPPDAALPDARPSVVRACPPPRFTGSCRDDVTACSRKVLHTGSGEEAFVHGITSDDTSVYWTEQLTGTGTTSDAYNALASGNLRRIAKNGGSGTGDILAREQPRIRAVTASSTHVYWSTSTGASFTVWRLPIDAPPCVDEVCAPPELVTTANGPRVYALLRTRDSVLFGNDDGALTRIGSDGATRLVATGGSFPTFTVTEGFAFAGGALQATIARGALAVPATDPTWAMIPDGGSQVGASVFANDCSRLYALKNDRSFLRFFLADGGFDDTQSLVTPLGLTAEVVSAVVDDAYVFFAVWNAGGVFAYRLSDGDIRRIADGNIWRVAVDDDGVYWGDHAPGQQGVVRMMIKE